LYCIHWVWIEICACKICCHLFLGSAIFIFIANIMQCTFVWPHILVLVTHVCTTKARYQWTMFVLRWLVCMQLQLYGMGSCHVFSVNFQPIKLLCMGGGACNLQDSTAIQQQCNIHVMLRSSSMYKLNWMNELNIAH